MNRRHLPRRRFDDTVLAALDILIIAGGAVGLYHWLAFAEMAPPTTMTRMVADGAPQATASRCVGGAQIAAASPHVDN